MQLLELGVVLGAGGGQDHLHLLGVVGQLLVDFGQPGQILIVEVYIGGRLINEVDGLVGQIPVGDVPLAHHHRLAADIRADGDMVEGLIIGGDALENLHRVVDGGLLHDDGLEAALQGGILLNVLAVLGEGGGADHLDLPPAQGGLEDIGGVHGALRVPRAHNGVDLVDDKDDITQLFHLVDEALHAALKLAAELGAGHQGGEVQQVDLLVQQLIGHVPVVDALGQPLGDGGFAHAGVADETGVVFLPPVQDLDGALNLIGAAHNAVQLALMGLAGEGDTVVLQELALGGLGPLRLGGGLVLLGGAPALHGVPVRRAVRLAAEQLAQEGEGGGAPLVLLAVAVLAVVLSVGGQAVRFLRAAEGGHHLGGDGLQVLVGDAHLFHHVVHRLDADLPGALQTKTLVFCLIIFDFGDKDHRHVFFAAGT